MHVVCDSCHGTVAEFSNCNTYQCPINLLFEHSQQNFAEHLIRAIFLQQSWWWCFPDSMLRWLAPLWGLFYYNDIGYYIIKLYLESKPTFQNTGCMPCCLFFPKPNNMLGSITGALYSLGVLASCIAVKDTSPLLLRSNMSVSSCCLSAVACEMLKLCPKHFHVWGSKLKSGCIIFMAAEKNQELWKLTRLLKLSLWWCICYICLCSIGQRT